MEDQEIDRLIDDYVKEDIKWINHSLINLGKTFTDEHKRRISENSVGNKGRKFSKEHCRRISESNMGHEKRFFGHTEESKEKISESRKGIIFFEEHRRNLSIAKLNMSDEVKQKISKTLTGKTHSEETKRKMSESRKGRIVTLETRKKISEKIKGENNGNWQGGASEGKYCEKFNRIFKEKIRKQYDYKCFLCNKTQEENGANLSVHHVNYNKECLCNDVKCEFVPLCKSCHAGTNSNQEYWELLITEMLHGSQQDLVLWFEGDVSS